jgi:hypothetical protein
MAKRRLTLSVQLPQYCYPRNEWRKQINAAALDAQWARRVFYEEDDFLEVRVVLNLSVAQAQIHDVDNRLKDVLDALQGRAGGPKSSDALRKIIPNDNRIFRVVIEKSSRSDRKRPQGRITIRKLPKRQLRML